MKTKKIYTVEFPEYALEMWEYGETEGEDGDNMEAWKAKTAQAVKASCPKSAGFFLGFSEEHFFSNSPAFGLACNCVDATIYAIIE